MKTYCPWLKSATFDLTFFLLPSIFSVVIAFLFSRQLDQSTNVPLWAWIVFVLCIDVSHVYSTLFRTYANSEEFREHKTALTLIPILAWLAGVFLYFLGALVFWRALAYLAVFHFIRQQYGFLRLYSKNKDVSLYEHLIDTLMIYSCTLYPILYWHVNQPRNFHWFVDGDFLAGIPPIVCQTAGVVYCLTAFLFIIKELHKLWLRQPVNLPKNLVIIGTGLSWYFGIVYFDGDMIFTMTNVVAHGIPYMALVWLYGERRAGQSDSPLIFNKFRYRTFFSWHSAPLFIGILLLFGYVEEGLWAGFIWREHLEAFGFFSFLPPISSQDTLNWLVPLLSLPQITHYVIDGFIWKIRAKDSSLRHVLFSEQSPAHQ